MTGLQGGPFHSLKIRTIHDKAAALIPEVAKWNDGKGIDLAAWGYAIGRFDHAIAYLQAFWSDFVLHDDCVFRHAPDLTTYPDWMRPPGDRQRVESVVNHLHILDMFDSRDFEPDENVVHHVAAVLVDMWSARLSRNFPQKRFQVEACPETADDLLSYEVTFFREEERRPGSGDSIAPRDNRPRLFLHLTWARIHAALISRRKHCDNRA